MRVGVDLDDASARSLHDLYRRDTVYSIFWLSRPVMEQWTLSPATHGLYTSRRMRVVEVGMQEDEKT